METSVLLLVFTIVWGLVLAGAVVIFWRVRNRRRTEQRREAAVLDELERVVREAADRVRHEARDEWDKRGW